MTNDLSPGAFLLTLVHLGVSVLCVASFLRERRERGKGIHAWIWLVLAVPVALLGLHAATGIGAEITERLRWRAHLEGWYAGRRELQGMLVRLVPVLGAVALCGLIWSIRRGVVRYLPAACAIIYLTGLGAIQAISLHAVDARMRSHVFGAKLETWLSAGGLALAAGAVLWSRACGRVRGETRGKVSRE